MERDHVDRMREAWAESDPSLDTSPLEVAGRLLRAAGHLQRSIEAALAPLDLSFGDFDVINTLRREAAPELGLSAGALARSALITSGAMTTRLARLERSGLLTRETDAGDRRGVLVRLTPEGEGLAVRAVEAVLAADRAMLEPLSERERETLARGLRKLLLAAEA